MKTKETYHLLSNSLTCILSVLNTSIELGIPVLIRSSKKVLSISICGKVVASGKTPKELAEAFKAAQLKAIALKKGETII